MSWIRCIAWSFCAATALLAPAQTFLTLVTFNGTNGSAPYGPLVQGLDGNLYGTTFAGGNRYGNVFRMTPAGALTTLHNFNQTDGAGPIAGLAQGVDGNFYGTTRMDPPYDYGTVFRITPSGTLVTLHRFNSRDGADPFDVLVQASDGNFYGTTRAGGANNVGTIFRITPAGKLTILHSFQVRSDGGSPFAGLIQGTDGALYGAAYAGGINGVGTVYKLTLGGVFTTLYSFNTTDGKRPYAGLIQAADGNFYGGTQLGGANDDGALFSMTPSGALTLLYSFALADGAVPYGVVQAPDGTFYGATQYGGAQNAGTVFQITPSGTLTTLHAFTGRDDGAHPSAGLVQATNGIFYGTTYRGHGTIFVLSASLRPFVETLPAAGKVGATVKILGTNLAGATSVTFNGTLAVFSVMQPSEITTTVPSGATTGTVQVKVPSGTLSSDVAFLVRP